MIKFRTITAKMTSCCLVFLLAVAACGSEDVVDDPKVEVTVSERNLQRAMNLTDKAISSHFTGDGMAMARFYNPYTNVRSEEKGSVWMYTAAIEAVNGILAALESQKEHGDSKAYDAHFADYADLLDKLIVNIDFYQGTYELISFTQTREWSVYGVNRGGSKGSAEVAGIMNVYDDQMWLVRELLDAYKVTGKSAYLEKAEYLTDYVLDGWDCTRNSSGAELGGIAWGPGYVTKHSCSNGPIVSPLVWLHEIYKGKDDQTTYRYIDEADKKTRKTMTVKKSDYYLDFAKRIYGWQKSQLLRGDGVYDDMRGGCSIGSPQTETINGTVYRKGTTCQDRVGPAFSYNTGSMLSGTADLYRATSDNAYLQDVMALSDASFQYFAKLGQTREGYYTYDIGGFNNWFNDVLMRAYVDAYPHYGSVNEYIDTFQDNLDYGYDHFLHEGVLPTNLLLGWSLDNGNNKTEGMFSFAFAAEYAALARYELEK